MNATENTPAPWTTGGIFDPNGPDPRTTIWGKRPRGAQSGDIIAHDVRLRDTDLIAAAPDLLTACKMALNDRMFKDWPEVATALIAAIAKAEGKDTP